MYICVEVPYENNPNLFNPCPVFLAKYEILRRPIGTIPFKNKNHSTGKVWGGVRAQLSVESGAE